MVAPQGGACHVTGRCWVVGDGVLSCPVGFYASFFPVRSASGEILGRLILLEWRLHGMVVCNGCHSGRSEVLQPEWRKPRGVSECSVDVLVGYAHDKPIKIQFCSVHLSIWQRWAIV